MCKFFRTNVKDFDKICQVMNKATCRNAEYKKDCISGKALESFNFLKTILSVEPVLAYPRSDKTYALYVGAPTATDKIEGGMVAILV